MKKLSRRAYTFKIAPVTTCDKASGVFHYDVCVVTCPFCKMVNEVDPCCAGCSKYCEHLVRRYDNKITFATIDHERWHGVDRPEIFD